MDILSRGKSGVYEIINKKNQHRYIGSSQNVDARLKSHLSMLKKNKHHSIYLQRAWNKYGEENFIMRTIIICNANVAVSKEQEYLDKLKPEYNIASCAEASARGAKRSRETCKKISEFQKGRTVSKESIALRVKSRDGYRHSENTKLKTSLSISKWKNTKQGKLAARNSARSLSRKVVCLDTGIVYNSIQDAEIDLGVDHSKISAVASGKRSHTGGYKFAYVEGKK